MEMRIDKSRAIDRFVIKYGNDKDTTPLFLKDAATNHWVMDIHQAKLLTHNEAMDTLYDDSGNRRDIFQSTNIRVNKVQFVTFSWNG